MASASPRSQSSAPAYVPHRRQYRSLPRRSHFTDADGEPTAPASTTSLASLTPPRYLPRVRLASVSASASGPALMSSSSLSPSASFGSSALNRTRRRRRSGLLASSSSSAATSATAYDDCPLSHQPPKKRRIEDYSSPQAEVAPLRLSLAYCDGGTYEGERYRVSNMLVDDDSVYCTERYSCNLVLQHETKQPFTLEWLEIKAPPHGFTSPVSEGVVAVTEENYNSVVKRISLYGRMVPLKKRAKILVREENDNSDREVEVRYRVLREDDNDDDDDDEPQGRFVDDHNDRREEDDNDNDDDDEDLDLQQGDDGDEYYLDGERVTEFDVTREEVDEDEDERRDDDDNDRNRDGYDADGGGNQEVEEPAEEAGAARDSEDAVTIRPESGIVMDSDPEDTVTGPTAWPTLGSQVTPRPAAIADNDGTADGNDASPHDCPYDVAVEAEDDADMDLPLWESDEGSTEEELRRWLLRNSNQQRQRMIRRRAEEEAAERGHAQSEACSTETYVRFELRNNKTCLVFDPPRYCKSVVLKLWGTKIDNVDIQAVLGYGYFGKRVFPAVEMR